MKIHLTTRTTLQDQDLAIRLQYAALRRAGDAARHQALAQNRWIAPDTLSLLSGILANEDCRLETLAPAEQASEKTREERVDTD